MGFLIKFDSENLKAFAKNWRQFLFLGIFLMALGAFALYATTYTTLLSVVLLGVIIFLCGGIILVDSFTFWRGKLGSFFLHLLLAVLYLVVGVMLFENPMQGSISLTLILGVFYIIAGVFRIGFYSAMQPPQWGWGWFNGMITLILGLMILTSWPVSSLFIIGLFVGIDLLFSGWNYIMAAFAARRLA